MPNITKVDLSTYVRVGRYDLPEPTRTTAPTNSLLAQEVSAVTYNKDTDTLFVVGDGSKSIVQVTKTGQLINSMTLALGNSPQGTDFYDVEGLTYIGNGKFVLIEERDRQANLFTYTPGTTLSKSNVQTVKLGTTVGNIGIEGISWDPQTNGFIAVKEITPEGIFQTGIDFSAGTATNGSATTVNSTNLFDPAKANLLDFADVYALSNLSSLNGQLDFGNLLVLSQESGKIVNIDRSGNISSSLTIVSDPGNPLSVADQQHEGLTMDNDGFLYVTSENGGGDVDHPQLWVYAPSDFTYPNKAPIAVSLNITTASLPENSSTATRIKVGNIIVSDDAKGTNNLAVTGADANFFEISENELYLKAGTNLDFETKTSYNVTINVDDPTLGTNPDATTTFTLGVTDINESPSSTSITVSEVAPWSSGITTIGADWFEVTNISSSPVVVTGWKVDDNSNAFASAVSLNGITTIAAGESVIFLETTATNPPATAIANFKNVWFGNNVPANLQIGTYQGSGVGLSTGGDAVNLFDGAGNRITGVNFGASPAGQFSTFDNTAGLGSTTLPLPTISALNTTGFNGAFIAANDPLEIGSPGKSIPAIISGNTAANVKEGNNVTNGKLTVSGSLTVTDTDPGQNKFNTSVIATSGNLGNLTITDTGSFTYNVDNSAVQYLGAGQTKVDSFTVTSLDGTASKKIEITINGVTAGFSGVAAGDATSNSAVLWTRTFDAATPTTQPGITENVTLQLSTDPNFATIPLSFTGATRDATRDYTLKIDATGLQVGTKYYYRFQTIAGELSSVGTFKTAPDANIQTAVRFAFSGDADGLMRPYSSTANFGSLNLDFFGFLGDTIYETASNGSPAAALTDNPNTTPAQLLTDYHRKYLENIQPVSNGGFSSLKTLYSSQGNYTLLDNHELGNKQVINGGAPAILAGNSGNGSNNLAYDVNTTGTFINKTVVFKTLEQAYSNYQPIREQTISAPNDPRTDGTQQLFFSQQWSQNLVYLNTDTRSYRDVRLKKSDANGNITTTDDTGSRADNPNRTLLGKTQLAWLKQTLLDAQKNGTIWKFVAVSDPIDQIGAIGSGEDGGKSWIGGYRAERNDLLKFIADNGIKNVVFLATDDHQNRINELTYTDNGVVKVLPNALSVVDGPIGATGPDAITNHSFANIKSLADDLALKQTNAGVNPVGLAANFPGLKNVVREGDPNADTLRQPIDFYSPDTFNYTVFDISADGKTLNVNVQGINSSATNSFLEPSAANPVRSILSFSLDAAPFVIESVGNTNLVKDTTNKYFTQIGTATPIAITNGGQQIYQNIYSGWQPLAAETVNGDNQVLWKNTTDNYLHIWHLDNNWNWVSSEGNWGLNSADGFTQETNFQLDTNGDGVIGNPYTSIESVGNTKLVKDSTNKYFTQTGTATPTSIKFAGQQIYQDIYSGWQTLAAETVNGDNQVLWKNTTDNYLHIWHLDNNWNWVSSEGNWGLNSADGFTQETNFQLDTNGDGVIGNPYTSIESVGNTKLVKDSTNKYFAQTGTVTPTAIKNGGQQIYQNIYTGWQTLAAETVNGDNQVLWKNTTDNYLHIWHLDNNWNWVSSEGNWGLNSDDAFTQETKFAIDANGDNVIGNPYTPIESVGNTKLVKDPTNKYFAQIGTDTPTAIKFAGQQIYSDIYPEWQTLAAETVNGDNQVLWKNVTNNYLHIWHLDNNWSWGSSEGQWALNSADAFTQETKFAIDANGDNVIGNPYTPIESVGNTKLVKDPTNKYFAQIGTDTPTAIKFAGQQIYSDIYPGWQTLAAETVNGDNQVLWKNVSNNYLHIWHLDNNWSWGSSEGQFALNSADAFTQETIFGIDANNDGVIGAPSLPV